MCIKLWNNLPRTIRLRFVVTGRLVCCKTSWLFSVSIVTGRIQAKRCSRINTISPVLAVNVGQRSIPLLHPRHSITHPTRLLFSFNRDPNRPNRRPPALFSYRSSRCVTTFDRVPRYRRRHTFTLMFAVRFTTSLWQLDLPFDRVICLPFPTRITRETSFNRLGPVLRYLRWPANRLIN